MGAIRVIGRVTESRLVPALPQGCGDWRIYIAGADSTGQGAALIRFPTGSDLMLPRGHAQSTVIFPQNF